MTNGFVRQSMRTFDHGSETKTDGLRGLDRVNLVRSQPLICRFENVQIRIQKAQGRVTDANFFHYLSGSLKCLPTSFHCFKGRGLDTGCSPTENGQTENLWRFRHHLLDVTLLGFCSHSSYSRCTRLACISTDSQMFAYKMLSHRVCIPAYPIKHSWQHPGPSRFKRRLRIS